MFHPPTILSSTGEPPTDSQPLQSRSLPNATTHLTRQTPTTAHHQSSSIHHHTTASSLSVQQEPDSGYEASPSSVTDNARSTFRFEEEPDDPSSDQDLEDEFEHLTDSMLLDSAEEWDCCRECGSSCSCNCRTDSATVAEDTSNCDNASDASSSCLNAAEQRPSSLPITIPNRVSAQLAVEDSNDHRSRRLVSSSSDRRPGHPLSWPLCALVRLGLAGGAVVPRFLSQLSPRPERLIQRLAEPQRLRRRHANSDEDVSSSSDSEGPEDVFNLSQEVPRPSPSSPLAIGGSAPSGSRLQPLPDIVQSSSGGGRRGRSVSVNLPPEPELLRSIGRSLIRLSDQFQRGREFCNGYACMRRRTTSDIYHPKRSS